MSNEIKHISGAAGGYLIGNSHKNGGIQAINKAIGKPLEMEGGEVVITKPAVEDNELREFEGEMLTNRQILSRINESGGGVSFAEKGAELPTQIEFCGTEYKYGGETLTDYEIAHRISKCGCGHEEEKYADGGELESIVSEKFTQGYGKVKYLEISESGGNWKYIHNPNMTVSQRKNAPVFAVESSEQDRKIAQENRINSENNLPTEISILDYAKKVAKSNNGKITHKSNSGSVYIQIENPNKNSDEKYQTIRISDHYILDRDSMNPKSRHDYEIVRGGFSENDSTDLKEIFEEETFEKGGEIKFSKIQKQEVINSQNKFWESNDIYKLSSNGLNVMRKDNSLNPPKYKYYQSFEDFHNEIKQREISKIERENAQKVFDYLETNGAELQHKSVYGSRYYNYKGEPIRVSNHWQTSEIKDSETGLNKYRDIASFYSDKPEGYKEMISKIENLFDKQTFANGGNLEKDLKDNAINVAVNATETLPLMEKGGKTSDNEFNYMMLSRLKTDNDYFLGNGNRNPKHLWATNVEDQITEMKRLWNILPVKPEWLSMEDILNYEKQMTDKTNDEKLESEFLQSNTGKKLKKDATFLVGLQDAKQNNKPSGGWDINLFKSSFYNKVKNMQSKYVTEIMNYLTSLEEALKVKPIFTQNHKIWEKYEKALLSNDAIERLSNSYAKLQKDGPNENLKSIQSINSQVNSNREPKYNINDFVTYKTGDIETETWVGVVKDVKDFDTEYAYRLDAYTTDVDPPMFDSEKTNETYEASLRPSKKETFEDAKESYRRWKNKSIKKSDLRLTGAIGKNVVQNKSVIFNNENYQDIAFIYPNGKIEYLVNDLPEEVIKYIESLPTPLEIGNKTTKPQIGQILDFGEGFEEVTRIVNHKGIDFIEAKKTDGSDNRLNLYPLSDYEKTLENQDIYKGFRELREKDQLQRDKYFQEQQDLAKTKTIEFNDIDSFAEDKPPLEKGKILKYLNKSYQIDGKLLTIKQEIRDAINNNGFVNENAQKEKTIRYTKDDRTFILSDQLQTKIGIEYAEYLIKKRNMNLSAKTYQISDYKNPYEVNRAIEALLDSKENDFTPNEIEFISHYSGYGGLEKQGSFSDEELKGLLYEYFTPDAVVKKMWALAYKYGFGTFSNPHIMEPSVGTGNFFKYAPTDSELFGNEINNYSKRVCEILYPKAMITLQPFEKNFISKNNSIKNKLNDIHKYHLVIGNPPYGRAVSKYLAMGESDYTKATSFTEYFITRGLDLLHPGGLLIFVVGAEQYNGGTLFLDSGISVVKKNIFDKAQLVDAYRLPTKIFERTGVASEILVFKKK